MYGLVEIAPIPAVPAHDLFTYRVPEALRDRLQLGSRVRVPLGRHTRTGVVTGFTETEPPGTTRPVLEVLEPEPIVPADLLALCRWTARYYLASLSEVIACVLPAHMPPGPRERWLHLAAPLDDAALGALGRRAPARARAYLALRDAGGQLSAADARAAGLSAAALRALVASGVVALHERTRAARTPEPFVREQRPTLNAAQHAAVAALTEAARAGEGGAFLLHGVTGSGKTEVFLDAAAATLACDRDVLVLVPEIALTHQLVQRTRARFGAAVAVLHSGLSPSERWGAWRRIAGRDARVVVGARSAVFAPVARLGLVVVDEEHDGAYKQEEGLRYHARDLAVVRARLGRAVVVLSSATPSAESFHAAATGRHRLLSLPERPGARPLPEIAVVDLRGRIRRPDGPDLLSEELRRALAETLAQRGQALVFLNRRGFSRSLQCPACGTPVTCPQCSVSLTWHRAARSLVCHHCRHQRPGTDTCASCGAAGLVAFGIGTEQVEALLRALHPEARIARLDRDAAQRAGVQERVLGDWHRGALDVLVGTQMVSKGHDVPGVTLVAVLLADLSLNVPDFRAAERTVQLLLQVAGRAGRGELPGRVVLQTLRPSHPAVTAAIAHDYTAFIRGELERRRELGYPPFARLVGVRLESRSVERVERAAHELAATLRRQAAALALGPDAVLGPAPPPVERVRGRHRRQILLRGAEPQALRPLARGARAAVERLRDRDLRIVIDVDPYSM